MRFVLVPLPGGKWVWELRGSDGEGLCRSSHTWADRANAMRAVESIRANIPRAQMFDPLGSVLALHVGDAPTASNRLAVFPDRFPVDGYVKLDVFSSGETPQ